jgi:ABC-type branched-subunit amino acid transport system permease subunit
VLVALLAASLLMSWRIRTTKFGMGLIAMREDEDKAATVGVNTPVYKLLGFVASAVFVGMAGAVYGYYLRSSTRRGCSASSSASRSCSRCCSAVAGRSGARCWARS